MTVPAAIHNFGRKLRQPALVEQLKDYVLWQAALRNGSKAASAVSTPPDYAPISINLDLTTACNYACDHCVDIDILNTGIRYQDDKLMESLDLLAKKGLRSVILIGGGEPTVYPKFEEVVRFLKQRDIHVAVVSNGAGNQKIFNCAEHFDAKDWVRLSLDSGSDETFQKMHKPKKKITLDQICESIPPIKEKNPKLQVGFSYIIVWSDAANKERQIVENIHEIVEATERARKYKFDYISLKPFLVRAEENNAEIVGVDDQRSDFDEVIQRIRREVDRAKKLETSTFRVVESTNLRVMEEKTYKNFTHQPTNCHMTFFRQVISPLGIFICPVYRHVDHATIGPKDGYAGLANYSATREKMTQVIQSFNAQSECKEVTCLYNEANWWIEDLIRHPEKLESLEASEENFDYFL